MAYTTSWQFTDAQAGLPPITDVSTTAAVPLGTTRKAVDRGTNANGEGEFMYVKGCTNGATGAWATINMDDYTCTLAVADAVGPLGIMMAALSATSYGWVQVKGKAVGKCLAGFVDNADVYLTATAGSVDDADVAGDYVRNAKGASAVDGPATGMAEFEIDYPSVADAKDN